MEKLPREFYYRKTISVAKDLLGKYLIHHINGLVQVGKIIETEAYLGPQDLASHSSKGRTKRTEIMFGPGGFAYVYMIYGMYYCMNVVTEKEGHASAVLIRAIEPMAHIHLRTKGPGLLCKAMNISNIHNGVDLLSDHFFIAEKRNETQFSIIKRPRIGVDYAGIWAKKNLRFYIKGHPFVSKR